MCFILNIPVSASGALRPAPGGRDALNASPILQDAVIRNFEVIGEAVKQLSPRLLEWYPAIPWRRVAGFRDVLIHDYQLYGRGFG
jgi:uncharacterized protein with HEPN domain